MKKRFQDERTQSVTTGLGTHKITFTLPYLYRTTLCVIGNEQNQTKRVKQFNSRTPPRIKTTVYSSTFSMGGPNYKNKKKGRQGHNHSATKDLGRWKPIDDLALIIGVQQTNDLRTVHLGTKFSCRFTLQELQQRWYALLYDEAVSRIAVTAMRNLHPDLIAYVQDRALWSSAEEQLLCDIPSSSSPTIETFEQLLSQYSNVFYLQRTAKSLMRHWMTLKEFNLLADQTIQALPKTTTSLGCLVEPPQMAATSVKTETGTKPALMFNDAEDAVFDGELTGESLMDEGMENNIKITQRKNLQEIRTLENETMHWHVLVDSLTGYSPPEFDSRTLAVFRGRLVRYLMRSKEITIGRASKDNHVDIDLNLEGPAWKISRRQATLRLRNTGEFLLSCEGKRPIFVDGKPILQGHKTRLFNNSVVEMANLKFIFTINSDLIRAIRNEAIKMQMLP